MIFATRPEMARIAARAGGRGALGARSWRTHGTPLASAPFRRLLVLVIGVSTPVGAFTLVAAAHGEVAGNADPGAGILALNAAGALLGALAIARWPLRSAPSRVLRPLALVFAVLYLPVAPVGAPVAFLLVAAFVTGLFFTPVLIQVFALTPRIVRREHSTEANAWVVSIFAVGVATGTLVAGGLIAGRGIAEGVPLTVVIVVLAAALLVIPVTTHSMRDDGRAPGPDTDDGRPGRR